MPLHFQTTLQKNLKKGNENYMMEHKSLQKGLFSTTVIESFLILVRMKAKILKAVGTIPTPTFQSGYQMTT